MKDITRTEQKKRPSSHLTSLPKFELFHKEAKYQMIHELVD